MFIVLAFKTAGVSHVGLLLPDASAATINLRLKVIKGLGSLDCAFDVPENWKTLGPECDWHTTFTFLFMQARLKENLFHEIDNYFDRLRVLANDQIE